MAASVDAAVSDVGASPPEFTRMALMIDKLISRATEDADRFPDVHGFLFDAPPPAASVSSSLGGTGRTWDYSSLAPLIARLAPRPVFVAGGIGPDNVRAALSASGASNSGLIIRDA